MGKHDFLTPKAIANRIKAKGLQKLRWYCQMCRKQCRDENGFKCHCMSESHQRQMQVFGENPDRFVDGYSDLFEQSFMEHIKRSHRFSRVAATVVYNEYISDRHHVHMNSTQWATLTEFVQHLGRTGQCKVDQTEKGWFISYIDREPETLLKESLKNKRERAEIAEEERHERAIENQIERAAKSAKLGGAVDDPVSDDKQVLKRTGEDEKVFLSFGASRSKSWGDGSESSSKSEQPPLSSIFQGEDERFIKKSSESSIKQSGNGRVGATVLAQLMKEEEQVKEKVNRKDYWLVEGLIVKIMSKSLVENGFYKQKGVVEKVIGKYVGQIKMLEGGAILKVDQEELETVIPQIGGLVKVVNGAYRGSTGKLLSIDAAKFTAKVQVEKGMYDGRVLDALEYEDICKISL